MLAYFQEKNIQQLLNKQSRKQKGSALMLAVFVMVVVTLLGVTLMRILSTGNETIAQEVLGTRALSAANSGMQAQLQKLFPLNKVAGNCPASTNYDFSTIKGLYQCTAVVSCLNFDNVNDTAYYRLESTGNCGTGNMTFDSKYIVLSSRTVQVEARELK